MRPARLGDGGQGTAELAVLLPVLVILLLAVVQIGLVARDHVALHHAAREVARRAAVAPREDALGAEAGRAVPGLDAERLSVALSGGRSPGDLLTVELVYRSPTAVPVVGALIGDVELTTSAVVRVE